MLKKYQEIFGFAQSAEDVFDLSSQNKITITMTIYEQGQAGITIGNEVGEMGRAFYTNYKKMLDDLKDISFDFVVGSKFVTSKLIKKIVADVYKEEN